MKLDLAELVPGMRITRQKQLAKDRKLAAYHEAGHFVTVRHFGAHSVESRIWETEEGPTLYNSGIVGTTQVIAMRGASFFRFAVVAWAGGLAEHLAETPFEEWHSHLDLYWEDREFDLHISPKDEAAINSHPMRWRSFKTAAEILSRRRAELERVACDLEKFGGVKARAKEDYTFDTGRIHTCRAGSY